MICCDKCKKECEQKYERVYMEVKGYSRWERNEECDLTKSVHCDLCDPCSKELAEIVTSAFKKFVGGEW